MKKYLLFLIIIKLLNFSTNNLISNDALFAKGHVIHDLKLNVTWLRCSVGQVWNEKKCVGKPLKFKISEVGAIIKQANNQLEGDWRLPNRKELENIVCMTCGQSFSLTRHMNHFGQEKKIIGLRIKISIGQLIFLRDILLEDFLVIFLTLLGLLKIDSFFL